MGPKINECGATVQWLNIFEFQWAHVLGHGFGISPSRLRSKNI